MAIESEHNVWLHRAGSTIFVGSEADLEEWAKAGRLHTGDMLRMPGENRWLPAEKVPAVEARVWRPQGAFGPEAARRSSSSSITAVLVALGVVALISILAMGSSGGKTRAERQRINRLQEQVSGRARAERSSIPSVQRSFTSEQEGLLRAMLNLNGHLCAEVVEMRRLQVENQVEVTCVRYRGGSARASYVLDTVSGRAFEQ